MTKTREEEWKRKIKDMFVKEWDFMLKEGLNEDSRKQICSIINMAFDCQHIRQPSADTPIAKTREEEKWIKNKN